MFTHFRLAILAFAFTAVAGFGNTASADDKDQTKFAVAQVFRAGEIIGMPVFNKNHEKIGKIDDLVVDMKSGDVRYAALSFGGFAGIGSKLFAVPFQSMTFMLGEPNNADSRHFMFDVKKEQLDNAPGFETSHWPNVGDPQWGTAIDKHYNFDRKHFIGNKDTNAPKVTYETVFRASKIKGMDVRNDANENLGSVDELVIDVTKGHIKYVALSFGSWFTGGNKLFAVPLNAFTLNHVNDKTFLTTHVSQEHLRNAPGFDKSHWPNTADANWANGIDTYYERTARRDTIRQ